MTCDSDIRGGPVIDGSGNVAFEGTSASTGRASRQWARWMTEGLTWEWETFPQDEA